MRPVSQALLALLSCASLAACGEAPAPGDAKGVPDLPVVAVVEVTRAGELKLDGAPATLDEVRAALTRLRAAGGGVKYLPEDLLAQPSPAAAEVLDAVRLQYLPLGVCEAADRCQWLVPPATPGE